jgi:hypothetical protein
MEPAVRHRRCGSQVLAPLGVLRQTGSVYVSDVSVGRGCVVVEPFSLAALGAAALAQGIGFVYGQLGELLRGRRERRSQAGGSPAETAEIPPPGEGAQILDGPLRPGPVDEDALDRHADQLAALRGLLLPYVEGDRQVEPRNSQLVDQVEAARLLLEEIYRQHITFEGEPRPSTGTALAVQAADIGEFARHVVASGERAVAIGGNVSGSTVITGDQVPGHRPAP